MARISLIAVLAVLCVAYAKKKAAEPDPKECEVCIANLEAVDKMLVGDQKKDKAAVRDAIGKRCTKSGFGSEWKPNPELTSPKDVKMCYYFEPIKEAITVPFITGMPKDRLCKRLKKENPEICEVKYPIKIEKKEGEEVNYGKMRVKQLKQILDQRGVKCTGCTEKTEYVKRCQETEHLEM
mmetsp:Transcript_22120/g.32215  ORF Transcript_22120/g.32215 Transcript_22120/m.32215 type:complete len:181 (+) Transcript_22120:123-665(+)|eukprot:CAMPEP_0185024946 /NCGR_PEP_ID=MMETSP1103-20130426/8100_1 /TAXON_ID=36769 /ORGANISM="Paraphysomonas bandaiensis, Strain Caron Lab Isolate" /LENGTH=180 /DNA_ID=CAMNT_0027558043 /DNA_START=79 /DNA_END=621 /DNA_ORIENTATION=-